MQSDRVTNIYNLCRSWAILSLTHCSGPGGCHAMTPRIPVVSLLDEPTGSATVDVRADLESLTRLVDTARPIQVPQHVAQWILNAASYLRTHSSLQVQPPIGPVLQMYPSPSRLAESPKTPLRRQNSLYPGSASPSTPTRLSPVERTPLVTTIARSCPHRTSIHSPSKFNISSFPSVHAPRITPNVKLNRQTILSKLYTYDDVHSYIEYPQTSVDTSDAVGHLFRRDPENWLNPARDFAYSLGRPSGINRTYKGQPIVCALLVDEDKKLVPCVETHSTCAYVHSMLAKYQTDFLAPRPRCQGLPLC